MGWTRYMYFKKSNVAIDIGKVDSIDDELWDNFNKYVGYINSDNPEIKVIEYLWRACEIYDVEMWVSLMCSFLGGGEILSEEELDKLKDVRVVNRE